MARSLGGLVLLPVLASSLHASADPGLSAEPSVVAGVMRAHDVQDGVARDSTTPLIGARALLGVHDRPTAGIGWGVGLFVNALHAESRTAIGVGLELDVDGCMTGAWRVGPRLAFSHFDETSFGEGSMVEAGVALRRPFVRLELDAFARRSSFQGSTLGLTAYDGSAWGLLSQASLTGRPGLYAEAVGVGVLLAAALYIVLSSPDHEH